MAYLNALPRVPVWVDRSLYSYMVEYLAATLLHIHSIYTPLQPNSWQLFRHKAHSKTCFINEQKNSEVKHLKQIHKGYICP